MWEPDIVYCRATFRYHTWAEVHACTDTLVDQPPYLVGSSIWSSQGTRLAVSDCALNHNVDHVDLTSLLFLYQVSVRIHDSCHLGQVPYPGFLVNRSGREASLLPLQPHWSYLSLDDQTIFYKFFK
jgi:hypothetical protein